MRRQLSRNDFQDSSHLAQRKMTLKGWWAKTTTTPKDGRFHSYMSKVADAHVKGIFLFAIGVLLHRIADNLDDCLHNVKTITEQATPVISGIERINQTGQVVAGALPLLIDAAEGVAAKLISLQVASRNGGPTAVPAGVGYLDN
jgi:hypothetical protein